MCEPLLKMCFIVSTHQYFPSRRSLELRLGAPDVAIQSHVPTMIPVPPDPSYLFSVKNRDPNPVTQTIFRGGHFLAHGRWNSCLPVVSKPSNMFCSMNLTFSSVLNIVPLTKSFAVHMFTKGYSIALPTLKILWKSKISLKFENEFEFYHEHDIKLTKPTAVMPQLLIFD